MAFVEDVRTFVREQNPEALVMVEGIKKITTESTDVRHAA